MFIPKYYVNNNDKEILQFVEKNSFGTIISNDIFPKATQAIFEIVSNENKLFKLVSHIGKKNPQTKNLVENPNVLCVFQGSHSYISSSWYSIDEVPTWNYMTVQVEGICKIITDKKLIWEHLNNLTNKYEKISHQNLNLNDLPEEVGLYQMNGIVAFEIEIKKIDCAFKLSQNRKEEDFKNIISELKKLNNHESANIAQEMQNLKCPFEKK